MNDLQATAMKTDTTSQIKPRDPLATLECFASPTRRLVINWILPGTSLAGGIKSNRLIAEAMIRLGHTVNIAYVALPRPWPKMWHVRRWLKRAKSEWATRNHSGHHLQSSTANLIPVKARKIESRHLPDADVTIATWWETREWIEDWPASKGIKAYFIRAHELHGGDPARVAKTYRMPGLKFVIARWLKHLMAETYGDPSAVLVPNGVDRSQFDSAARDRAKVPTVGMLYGVAALKGAATAFNSLRILKTRFPELRAIAFGSQPPMAEHDPPPWLEYHLRPDQRDIPRLYQEVDCWIVPSTTEGFGMPGIEAAACHCPIVSTRCGGPEDYVEDGVSGFLVPIGDSEAIAEAVGRVLSLGNEQWRAMSKASYEISRRFDWDQSAVVLQNELLRALKDR